MGSPIQIEVTGELVIDVDHLPGPIFEQLKAGLTFPNEEKEKQASLRKFGWWDLPDTIALWKVETRRGGRRVLCLPRGSATHIQARLADLGHGVAWHDHRVSVPAAEGYFPPFLLRDYQVRDIVNMLKAEQGVYKCPAGGGKTVTMLGLMTYAGQRTIVMVDRENLVEQWRKRAHDWLGLSLDLKDERSVGKISAGVWEERDLTICLRQTLWSRDWSMDATGWWKLWGLWIDDECHHLAAETTGSLVSRVVSKLHFGPSATPAKSPVKGAIVYSLLGPIVAETTRQELYDRNVLMKPTVEIEAGALETAFWKDHEAWFDKDTERWICNKPGCREGGRKHSHRNNYSSVLKTLVEDAERNRLIASRIVQERGHIHLVPSRQLKHLELIKKACIAEGWPKEKIWFLRGEENQRGESQEIVAAVEASDEAIVLATVAEEAMDIPPIDRVHLVFPIKDESLTIQTCGRCERIYPGKENPIVVDWVERNTACFADQAKERERTYRIQGYEIIDQVQVA